ncbi:MAG TPA: TspO/MBR family protein [Candidatus Paceibacterota bacterium]
MKTIVRYIIAIAACYASLYVGMLFVGSDIGEWYAQLGTHALAFPPSLLVALVLIIYGVTGFATGLLWSNVPFWHQWVGCFFISLIFGSAWIMFLFGYHVVIFALFLSVCLIVMVIPLMMGAWEIHRRAAYLFIPYFVWIFYVLYFTAAVWLGM